MTHTKPTDPGPTELRAETVLLIKLSPLLLLYLPIWRFERPLSEGTISGKRIDGLIGLSFVILGLVLVGWLTAHRVGLGLPQRSGNADEAAISSVRGAEDSVDDFGGPVAFNESWRGWNLTRSFRQGRTYLLQLIPFVVVMAARRQGPGTVGLSRENLQLSLLLGLAGGLILALALGPGPLGWIPALVSLGSSEAWSFLGIMVVVAFAEEVIFRGFVQRRLVAWLGAGWGVALSVSFFTVVHLPIELSRGWDGPGSLLVELLPYAVGGLVYGLLFHRTSNLAAPILVHAFGNWAL